MLYIATTVFFYSWMLILLRKRVLSWHSVLIAYVTADFAIDMLEVLFNLILHLYSFPTHLRPNPIEDNQLGIIFADTVILPAVYIVYIHFARKSAPWRVALPFACLMVTLEWAYLRLGYLQYHRWSILLSAFFYVVGFRVSASLARRIAGTDPPISYGKRLLALGYTAFMWTGALPGFPIMKLYQFRPGLFSNPMVDDRVVDLYSGLALAALCALLLPGTPRRFRTLVLAALAALGVAFGLWCYARGWLIYHRWHHLLTVLRYLLPVGLIWLYDRLEQNHPLRYDPAGGADSP